MLARALCLPLAALALTACTERPGGELAIETETVALFPGDPGRRDLGRLTYTGGIVVMPFEETGFGGWSAIEITPDGERLLAISDTGAWLVADLLYDEAGALAGLARARQHPMLGPDGAPLRGPAADAEGLAPLGEGRYAVSFEREHRILVYDIGEDWDRIETAVPEPYNQPPGLSRLRANGGIEALAPAEEGLWAAVEYPIVSGQPHTVWHLTREDAVAHSVRLSEGFALTGLARADEDRLIAVQRFWSRQVGNIIRITAISDEDLARSGMFAVDRGPDIIAEITPDMTVDNIEGAAIAEIGGRKRLFLMSDDNFNPAQRTLLLSFSLPEDE